MYEVIAPVVAIEIGGKERHLKLDFNGIAQAETATGKNFMSVRAFQHANGGDITAILWGGLLHESPELTLAEVRSWVTLANINPIITKVFDAVRESFPQPKADDADVAEDDEEAPTPAPKAGRRGSTSGASDAATSA